MRLRANELKKRADEAGVSVEQLADAVSSDRLSGDASLKAVKNWMGGKGTPRCTRSDIENMATAVGCLPREIAKFTSQKSLTAPALPNSCPKLLEGTPTTVRWRAR